MGDLGKLLSVQEICDYTGLSRTAVYQARKAGNFAPEIMLGERRVAFPEKLFVEWLEARRRRTATACGA
jgi:excisionase family DNA binding protein